MGDDVGTPGAPATPSTRTFLIADVRGYTTYTRERGDDAAARLATDFAEIARRVSAEHEGTLLELRGDEALVVFVSVRNAVRSAIALQAAFRSAALPRGVGIGLDAGEAIPVGDGYRGSALNMAARLCSKAEPGQVLASETVTHLAGRLEGIAYVDARTYRLKGYGEPVRAVEVLPENQMPSKLARRYRRMRSRLRAYRRIRIGIAAVVVAALLGSIIPFALGGGSPIGNLPPGSALLDAKSLRVIERHIAGTAPNEAGVGKFVDGSFWGFSVHPSFFFQVDPHTGRTLKRISSPTSAEDLGTFAIGGGSIWLTNLKTATVTKVDIASGRQADEFDLQTHDGGSSIGGIQFGSGSLWVTRFGPGKPQVLRLDPSDGSVEHAFDDVAGSDNLYRGVDSVWAASGGGITRIDAKNGTVTPVNLSGELSGVTEGGGYGWATDQAKGIVYKIDPASGGVVGSYETGDGATDPVYDHGIVWIANTDAGTATRIDALTGARRTIPFGHPVTLAVGGGVLAVDLAQGRSYEARIEALKGKVARFFTAGRAIPEDSATASDPFEFQIERATCAKLLNYADDIGGPRLIPEIAAALPTVSRDKRTYTFTIRSGYRFSPPANSPVTAQTMLVSIERALSPKLRQESPAPGVVGDIEGESAFRAGRTAKITGLRATGDTLSITLQAPSPDFLERLATPYFCPVPDGTPFVEGAMGRLLPGSDGTTPSAGPYYIADHLNGEYVILKRNPNYTGPRPHALDAIAFRMGVDPGKAVRLVEDGRWDGIIALQDPVLSPNGALAGRWGPASDAAKKGDQRFFQTPLLNADYLVFNEAQGHAFADPALRRAVASALNRTALAAIFDETPDDRLVGDSMSAFAGGHAFPLESPVPAKRSGPRRTLRMITRADCRQCEAFDRQVESDLDPLGIDLSIDAVDDPFGALRTRSSRYDLLNGFSVIDYPDGAGFLRRMLIDDAFPGWISSSIVHRVEALDALAGEARQRQAAALAQTFLRVDVPVAVFGISGTPEFFSPRIGCRVFHSFDSGVDLAALCLT